MYAHCLEMLVLCYCVLSVCMCADRLLFCCEQKGRLVSESVLEQDGLHNILMISSAERISLKALL